MSRLPGVPRDQLTPEGQAVWDSLVSTRGARIVTPAGSLSGPFNAFVNAPGPGLPAAELGAALRYGCSFGQRLTEVAIITIAVRWRSEYEWYSHSRFARELGVPDAVVDAIGSGSELPADATEERIVYATTRELVETGHVGDETYETARELLGESGLAELVMLCGYYCLISFVLNAFSIALPPGAEPMWAQRTDPAT